MGGDGGVIASNRKYMRGAGTADHTADASSRSEKQVSDRADARERMATCALTNAPLQFGSSSSTIVACPYGRLYHKEAAVETLLRRKQQQQDDNADNKDSINDDELGEHIRGLKDLYEARFSLTKKADGSQVPSCPVTGQEFNGQHPVILLVPGNKEMPNVVSQRAFKEVGEEALQTEYGPFKDQVRLAPPAPEMEEIVEALEAKRLLSKSKKSSSKKDKKRKERGEKNTAVTTKQEQKPTKKSKGGTVDLARGRVTNAVKSNDVLSSLFTKDNKNLTQKERNDTLFARCG